MPYPRPRRACASCSRRYAAGAPEVPTWNGNEFLLADGRRPPIRTFTPLRVDSTALELDVEVVLHDGGAASEWARTAQPGDEIALSGPGRGYTVDAAAPGFLVGGDETALPAITELLAVLPDVPVAVHIEIAQPEAKRPLPGRDGVTTSWHVAGPDAAPGDALVAAIGAAPVAPGASGCGSRARRLRSSGSGGSCSKRGRIPRAQTTIRGYWKHGRAGGTDEA